MKTLLLFRHGKSDWNADYVGDHQRPLLRRGEKAAENVGCFLNGSKQVPGRVLCSTALRTRQTLDCAMEAGKWQHVDVVYDETVYLAGYSQLLSAINGVGDDIDRLMLVGHEPTMSLMAGQLIGGASLRFPTAAVARIDLNIEHWKNCRTGVGTLIWHVIPKHLKNACDKDKND